MNLQFADLNDDGHNDIVTATYAGASLVVYGSKEGWQPEENMVDAEGENIVLSLYYDTKAKNFFNADRSPEGKENAQDHGVSTTAYDWDNDGDLDLLVGAKAGRLYLRENLGSKSEASYEGFNTLLMAGGDELSIPGGLTAVRPFDWDGDGDDDFLCGSFKGGLYLVENIGKTGAIELAAPKKVLNNEFKSGEDTYSSQAWYIDLVDYDTDGKTDLLVGMHAARFDDVGELTPEETKEYRDGQKRMLELEAEMSTFAPAFRGLKPFKKLANEFSALSDRAEELRPLGSQAPSIWVFRGK